MSRREPPVSLMITWRTNRERLLEIDGEQAKRHKKGVLTKSILSKFQNKAIVWGTCYISFFTA